MVKGTGTCDVCGAGFVKASWNSKRCSAECRKTFHDGFNASYYQERFAADHEWDDRRECVQCGDPFVAEQHRHTVCSGECRRQRALDTNKAVRASDPDKYRAKSREYYATHTDERKAYQRQYVEDNRDLVRRRQMAYYTANRGSINARQNAYRAENIEALRAADRKRYHDNHDVYRERRQRYYESHPEVFRAASLKRKAALRGSAVVWPISPATLAQRVEMQNGRCWMCGDILDGVYHMDHVKPISAGGIHVPANLRPACEFCNLSKHANWPVDTSTKAVRLDPARLP